MNKIDIQLAKTIRVVAKDFVDGSLKDIDSWRKEWDKTSAHLTPDETAAIREMMVCCFLSGGVLCFRSETYRKGFASYDRVTKESLGTSERHEVPSDKGKEA